MPVQMTCWMCGKTFTVSEAQAKLMAGTKPCCSVDCAVRATDEGAA